MFSMYQICSQCIKYTLNISNMFSIFQIYSQYFKYILNISNMFSIFQIRSHKEEALYVGNTFSIII